MKPPTDPWTIIGLLVFILYLLVFHVVIPQYKKRNGKAGSHTTKIYVGNNPHPISLDRFYQAFLDHAKSQEEWCKDIGGDVDSLTNKFIDLDKRVTVLEKVKSS